MKTLYLECKTGAAGDMLMSALYELTDRKKEFIDQMNTMFGDKVHIQPQLSQKCGIAGTHMLVHVLGTEEMVPEDSHDSHHHNMHAHHHHNMHAHHHHNMHAHHHHHEHHSYQDIMAQIRTLPVSEQVRHDASEVYRLIGEAEAKVHNSTLDHIHFHEVGSYDALADVVGCCLLLSYIKPDRILASPIHVGNGTVHCAHGVLPVPAPATAEILKGIPYYTGSIQTELCTPTGAAILKHFVNAYSDMPSMRISDCGIGLGTKELPVANMIRIFSGETDTDPVAQNNHDTIIDLSCNLDDITGEALGFAMEQLLAAGALDVFYIPIQMKKNRPGILLHCLCEPADRETFTRLIFTHTTTRGIRYQEFERAKLNSSLHEEDTPFGTIHIKKSEGYGTSLQKIEYEDRKKIALEQGLSLREIEHDLQFIHLQS